MAVARRGVIDAVPAPGSDEILAALPVAALLVDAGFHIQRVNSATETLLNLGSAALIGRPLGDIITVPADHARDDKDMGGFAAYDVALRTTRGHDFTADFVDVPFADRPGWRLIMLHDTAIARRMGQGVDRPGGARAAVGAAAMLAHEIKNPLSGIRGAAQLIDQASRDEARDLTRLIVTEVDRIAALIDRMQDFTDQRPRSLTAQNIYPLLSHACSVARSGFAGAVDIVERYDPSLPDVLTDGDSFVQVVLNLVKNACEGLAGQADGRITLATGFRHGMSVAQGRGRPRVALPIELLVIDNGPGVPTDIVDHMFDPFVSGKPGGQGLGLALVDKLVRDMGGIVHYVRDEAAGTTTFRVLLPRGDTA